MEVSYGQYNSLTTAIIEQPAKVLDPRSALLSNHEVLTLLRELESDYLTRAKTAIRVKKEEEAAGSVPNPTAHPTPNISENLRTIEVEVRDIIL